MTPKHFLITTIILSTCLTACQATPKKSTVEGKEAVSLPILSPPTPSEPIPIPPVSAVPALYTILIADTRDRNIGDSTLADLNNMKTLVENISKQTQLPSYPLVIQGSQLSRQAVINMLTQLSVTSQDLVIFYYSGHGTRGFQSEQRDSKWPYLCVNGGGRCTEKENRLDLDEVVAILKQKGPRFFIAMADACNDLIKASGPGKDWSVTGPSKPANYRKLFLEPEGHHIIASGSKIGQVSVGDNTGGKFTNQFLNVLYAELAADYSPNWQTIMQGAVVQISYPDGTEEKIQQPQFEFQPHNVAQLPAPSTPVSALSVLDPDPVPPVPEAPIKLTPVNSEEIHLEILPGHRLRPGEAAQLAVSSTQSGYLFIFDAENNNGGGTLSQVFPNSAYQERSGRQYFQLQANTKFLLPDERYFELAANIRAPQEVGPHSLVALLITADQNLEKVQQLSNRPISAITDWLHQHLQNNQWVMTTTTYEITQ